jgi:hypothetical protein
VRYRCEARSTRHAPTVKSLHDMRSSRLLPFVGKEMRRQLTWRITVHCTPGQTSRLHDSSHDPHAFPSSAAQLRAENVELRGTSAMLSTGSDLIRGELGTHTRLGRSGTAVYRISINTPTLA